MRRLKENNLLYGGVHIVFVGDFFQMLPVKGSPLFKSNSIQFAAINKAIFLNVSHRFNLDPEFGEIMRRFRIGKATQEDIIALNERHVTNNSVILPPIKDLRCACYMNDERNAYNNVIFMKHLEATHQKYLIVQHAVLIILVLSRQQLDTRTEQRESLVETCII